MNPPSESKVIAITGAAHGIASTAARRFCVEGARVGLIDIDGVALDGLSRELGESALGVTADVTESHELEQAFKTFVERFGRIDAVVANAATIHISRFAEADPEKFRRVIDVNVVGSFLTAKAALPHLATSGGYLLFVSSISGLVQGPFQPAYNASKAAVDALANTLRHEATPLGVDVGTIFFHAVDTPTAGAALHHELMRPLSAGRAMKPAPVEGAAAAIVSAVRQRTRVSSYPKKGPLWIYRTALIQRLVDRMVARRVPGRS